MSANFFEQAPNQQQRGMSTNTPSPVVGAQRSRMRTCTRRTRADTHKIKATHESDSKSAQLHRSSLLWSCLLAPFTNVPFLFLFAGCGHRNSRKKRISPLEMFENFVQLASPRNFWLTLLSCTFFFFRFKYIRRCLLFSNFVFPSQFPRSLRELPK